MKTSFDTDSILFSLLRNSPVHQSLTGGIYLGDTRPADSHDEDIEVNTISLTQDSLPQLATSNVNIYVPDMLLTINGRQQKQANRTRLKELADKALNTIRTANITGLKIIINGQSILAEPAIDQHFVNIRLDWNIQTI